MSLNNKLNDIAEYVHNKLPGLDLDNLSVADNSVNEMCNFIFHKNDRVLKKTVVNALKRQNSSLRVMISAMRDNSLSSNISRDASKIIKCLESCNYTCADFQQYNVEVIDDVCKRLKIKINNMNRLSLFRKCQKALNQSYVSTNNLNDLCVTIQSPTLEDNSCNSVASAVSVIDDSTVSLPSAESSNLNNLSCVKDISGEVKDTGLLNSERTSNETEGLIDLSVVTFKNIVTSTPEEKLEDLSERQISISNNKCYYVESPLKRLLNKRTPVKSGVILPVGTKNRYLDQSYVRRQNNDKNFGGCTVFEGKFRFTKEEWSYIVYKNEQGFIRLDTSKYPTMFRKRLKTVNNTCVVNFKSVNYPRTMRHYLVYMYCCHPGCKSFRLKVVPQESVTIVSVYSSGLDYYHKSDNSLTNHVRGIQRNMVRQILKETKAFKYSDEAVKCASPSKLSCGNLQDIKSDDVIRKIRSEAMSADDYAKEDFEDLIGMYNNDNYIKHVGLPSYVHCYSDEQLELLTSIKSKGKGTVTGYLDATGTVVRKINHSDKRILYYAIVVSASLPAQSSVTCPIVEMVSSSHDIVAISQWLNAFKAFVLKKNREWPLFTNVVTDFSYAQMHSLCIGWNGLSSIFDYLNYCYSVLFEHCDGTKLTVINVCANHYTKIIVNHVRTQFLKTCDIGGTKRLQNSVIDWICLLFNMDNMKDIEMWFKLFTTVLSSRSKTQEVLNALSILQNKCMTQGDVESYDEKYNDNCLDDMNKVLCETQTSKSMMYCRFKKISERVKNDYCDLYNGCEVNEFFDEDYLQQFILKCVPFIPLWTPVMNKILNTGVKFRQSNATVESWFKTVKKDMLDGDRRLKCGRFLRKTHDRVRTVCKQVKFSIRKKKCTRVLNFGEVSPKLNQLNVMSDTSRQDRLSRDETFLNSVEEWGKKEKQHKHLQPVGFRPFKTLKLKNPIPLNDISERVLSKEDVILIEPVDCDLHIVPEESINGMERKESITNLSRRSLTTPGCYNSPFRLDNCDVELYENMLPKDLDYYKLIKMPKGKHGEYYTVGKYSCILNNDYNDVLPDLDIRDFESLSGENWLNNFVIDVCLKLNVVKQNLQNVEVMSCNTVKMLLEPRDVGESRMQQINIKENSTVFMPWNINSNHWIIAVVNFKTTKCFIMDPQNPVSVEDRTSQNRFKLLCKSLISNCVYGKGNDFPSLSLIPCPMENIPSQLDGCNCGVYIIYYAFTIMTETSFDLDFDPTAYRTYLKKYLLQNSDNMYDVCLFCGRFSNKHRCQEDESAVNWVSCSRCCRWIAVDCMPEEYRLMDFENCYFLCPLCGPQKWTKV